MLDAFIVYRDGTTGRYGLPDEITDITKIVKTIETGGLLGFEFDIPDGVHVMTVIRGEDIRSIVVTSGGSVNQIPDEATQIGERAEDPPAGSHWPAEDDGA